MAVTLATTTTTSEVDANCQQIALGSLAALTPEAIDAGACLFFDGELCRVVRTVGLSAVVQRAVGATTASAHVSGLTVYIGTPGQFYTSDPVGAVPTSPQVTPWINTAGNRVWVVAGSAWVDSTSSSGAPSTPTYLTSSDATAVLPNSRVLTAGTNVTLDATTPGVLTLNAGAGSVTASGSPVAGNIPKFSTATNLVPATTTGTGNVVLATSPTLTTPALGTPSALVLTNATGTPTAIVLTNGTGLSLATGVTGDLPLANLTPASAASVLLGRGDSGAGDYQEITLGSNLTMTGTVLAATGGGGSGTVTHTGALTADAIVLGNASADIKVTTTGTGIVTALGVNVGSAGAPVVQNGVLGTPSSGTLTNATGLPLAAVTGLAAGVATFLGTPSSANLATAVTDETGSGALVFATSPTLVTPILGTPTSGTLTNCTLPVGGVTGLAAGVATFLATPSSANLAAAVTDETGSGAAVFATSPTLVTPLLGTPTSGTLTNCTLPVGGVTGLGSNVATFLATPTSANLAAALTDETGSGANVFATSPTLVTPLLGTPTSGTLTNCTIPVGGVTGLGTNVATFLATPSTTNLNAALTSGQVPIILANSGTASAATSLTAETNLIVVTIPAGLLGANGSIEIDVTYKFVGTNGTKTPTIRHSTTSGDTSAGTLIFNVVAGASSTIVWRGIPGFANANSVSAQVVNFVGGSNTVGNGPSTLVTGVINTANTSYINFNSVLASGSDSAQITHYRVAFYPAV